MVDCGEQSLSLNAYKALTHGYPQVALINLAPSSIIHHPSSIIHHPSSIIHQAKMLLVMPWPQNDVRHGFS